MKYGEKAARPKSSAILPSLSGTALAGNCFAPATLWALNPFYYFHDGKKFLFASELAQILEDPTVGRGVNEGMVGEFLAALITSREETLYSSISRLPQAHFLVVGPQKFHKQRYWDIDLQRQLHYAKSEDYSDHFFEIFKDAVRCCMRCNGPVGAELSGGLGFLLGGRNGPIPRPRRDRSGCSVSKAFPIPFRD